MVDVEAEPCPTCKTPTRWWVTIHGTRMRLDVDPHPNGTILITTTPTGSIRAQVMTGVELPTDQPAYRQHRCPRCTYCGRIMAPAALFTLLGWDTHPGCDPEFQALLAADARAAAKTVAATVSASRPAKRTTTRRKRTR